MDVKTLLLVASGGALGTLARYTLAAVLLPISRSLPWGTVLINIAGSFVIGFFGSLTLASGRFPASEALRLFVMVGICGGFTTFSAFSLQTLDLLRQGAVARAMLNVALSVMLCLLAVALGDALGSRLGGGTTEMARAVVGKEV